MTVHICTIGWEDADRIIEPMKDYSPTKVYLIHGRENVLDPKSLAKQNAEKIRARLGDLVASELIEVNPHDLLDAYKRIDDILHREEKVYINFTSGTKILIGAALMASVVHINKVKGLYYGKPNKYLTKDLKFNSSGYGGRVSLPIFTSEFEKIKENWHLKSIFKILLDQEGKHVSSIEELTMLLEPEKFSKDGTIGKEEKSAMAKVRYHLTRLEDLNYIYTQRERKKLKIGLTESGEIAARVILAES